MSWRAGQLRKKRSKSWNWTNQFLVSRLGKLWWERVLESGLRHLFWVNFWLNLSSPQEDPEQTCVRVVYFGNESQETGVEAWEESNRQGVEGENGNPRVHYWVAQVGHYHGQLEFYHLRSRIPHSKNRRGEYFSTSSCPPWGVSSFVFWGLRTCQNGSHFLQECQAAVTEKPWGKKIPGAAEARCFSWVTPIWSWLSHQNWGKKIGWEDEVSHMKSLI